jgi:hypothetical protein
LEIILASLELRGAESLGAESQNTRICPPERREGSEEPELSGEASAKAVNLRGELVGDLNKFLAGTGLKRDYSLALAQ